MRPPDGEAKVVITVQVEDLDATVERAKAEGGAVAMAKIPVPTMGWVAYVTDPQGTVMGLMQPDENVAD
jgi:predicted enzyme related to lactoylglutathione lyase